jgi:hypothetical protein
MVKLFLRASIFSFRYFFGFGFEFALDYLLLYFELISPVIAIFGIVEIIKLLKILSLKSDRKSEYTTSSIKTTW